jgi:DNA topoisomerase-2
MIMSDQDTDGSHIKGLVINFIHNFWPSLFQMPGFIKQFITPLLKVSKGHNKISFYTMSDFKVWTESVPDLNTWNIKYYKGLGTSDDKEAKEYFSDMRKHRIDF